MKRNCIVPAVTLSLDNSLSTSYGKRQCFILSFPNVRSVGRSPFFTRNLQRLHFHCWVPKDDAEIDPVAGVVEEVPVYRTNWFVVVVEEADDCRRDFLSYYGEPKKKKVVHRTN